MLSFLCRIALSCPHSRTEEETEKSEDQPLQHGERKPGFQPGGMDTVGVPGRAIQHTPYSTKTFKPRADSAPVFVGKKQIHGFNTGHGHSHAVVRRWNCLQQSARQAEQESFPVYALAFVL